MNKIKSYSNFNEYSKIKEGISQKKLDKFGEFLSLPKILIDRLISKVINYIPELDYKYKVLSLKTHSSFGPTYSIPSVIKHDIKQIDISDIENDKLRRSLRISGLFSKWNVYAAEYTSFGENKGNKILNFYITKDNIKKNDVVYLERIYNYRDLGNIFLYVCAKKTERHDISRKIRDDEFSKDKLNKFKNDIHKRMNSNSGLPDELIKRHHEE